MLVLVANFLIDVVSPDDSGEPLTSGEVNELNNLWLLTVQKQLRRFLNETPNATTAEFHAEAVRVQKILRLEVPINPAQTLLDAEALKISKEQLTAKLAAKGLPPPANIELHAAKLAQAPEIFAIARRRVEAQLQAGRELEQA